VELIVSLEIDLDVSIFQLKVTDMLLNLYENSTGLLYSLEEEAIH
jgi:hypothetical protein